MNRLKRKYKKLVSTRKGVTLVQIFFIVVIIIALAVLLNPIDLISKTTRGRTTAGWTTDATNLANSVLANKERYRMQYSVNIKSDTPRYDLTVAAPAVAAYDPMKTLIVEKGTTSRLLTYDANSTVGYTEGTVAGAPTATGAITPLTTQKLYDFKNRLLATGVARSTEMKGLTHAGSQGIAPFVNLSVPKVEENLFLGLLGANNTELGKEYEKSGKLTSLSTTATVKQFLELAFGKGTYTDLNNNVPDRWVTLNLLNTDAMKEILGGNSRFYDQERYRLYWVTSIATEAEALNLAKTAFPSVNITDLSDPVTKNVLQVYKNMTENILQDTLVIMPTDKNDAVYSEDSDFKLFKFSTAD